MERNIETIALKDNARSDGRELKQGMISSFPTPSIADNTMLGATAALLPRHSGSRL
jgi:hypothetical protein